MPVVYPVKKAAKSRKHPPSVRPRCRTMSPRPTPHDGNEAVNINDVTKAETSRQSTQSPHQDLVAADRRVRPTPEAVSSIATSNTVPSHTQNRSSHDETGAACMHHPAVEAESDFSGGNPGQVDGSGAPTHREEGSSAMLDVHPATAAPSPEEDSDSSQEQEILPVIKSLEQRRVPNVGRSACIEVTPHVKLSQLPVLQGEQNIFKTGDNGGADNDGHFRWKKRPLLDTLRTWMWHRVATTSTRVDTKAWSQIRRTARLIVASRWFNNVTLFAIVVSSAQVGVETNRKFALRNKLTLEWTSRATTGVFLFEIFAKWMAGFVDYWKSSWNVFDFVIVLLALVGDSISSVSNPQIFMVFRVFRSFRSLRTISALPDLQVIIRTIFNSLPDITNILLLGLLLFFLFGMVGVSVFSSTLPRYFSTLDDTFFTLWVLTTQDGYMGLIRAAEEQSLDTEISLKIFVVLFITISAFVIVNVLVGVLVTKFSDSVMVVHKPRARRLSTVSAIMNDNFLDNLDGIQTSRRSLENTDLSGSQAASWDDIIGRLESISERMTTCECTSCEPAQTNNTATLIVPREKNLDSTDHNSPNRPPETVPSAKAQERNNQVCESGVTSKGTCHRKAYLAVIVALESNLQRHAELVNRFGEIIGDLRALNPAKNDHVSSKDYDEEYDDAKNSDASIEDGSGNNAGDDNMRSCAHSPISLSSDENVNEGTIFPSIPRLMEIEGDVLSTLIRRSASDITSVAPSASPSGGYLNGELRMSHRVEQSIVPDSEPRAH